MNPGLVRKQLIGMPMPASQRGAVLFIALIVMVAMTLAAIGMMRSIDTTTMIAGNLAFKQTTIHAGDVGIDEGYKWLMTVQQNNPVLLTTNQSANNCTVVSNPGNATCQGGIADAAPAYWASVEACEINNSCVGRQWWSDIGNWYEGQGSGVHVYPPDAIADDVTKVPPREIIINDPNGNRIATVRFLIHRMCDTGNNCQSLSNSAALAGNSEIADSPVYTISSVLYRITSRTEGFRGAVSYAQAFVRLPGN